jgi:hypothetical protein
MFAAAVTQAVRWIEPSIDALLVARPIVIAMRAICDVQVKVVITQKTKALRANCRALGAIVLVTVRSDSKVKGHR